MIRWLRQHRYALRVPIIRLASRPLSSLANIIVLALALAVPFIGWSLLLSTQPLAQHIPIATEMTLFIQADASPEQRQALETQLNQELDQWIEGFEFISRDQALDSLKDNPSWDQALSVLDENPLPDAYILQLNDQSQAENSIAQLVTALEAEPAVEQVLLDIDWLQKLDTLLDFARQALLFLSLGVILIDRKSTRLNSSHVAISYAVFFLK